MARRRVGTSTPLFLLRNATDLRSDDLKHFILRCLDNELEERGMLFAVSWDEDKHTRNISGYSFQGLPIINLVIPRKWRSTANTVSLLAQIMLHELGHTYGLDEHEIPPLNRLNVEWAEGLKLRRRAS